ncbi:MAG TPA: efflux RND transporter periplasmic adaptor subunit, partial [Bacteroidota bacterium]
TQDYILALNGLRSATADSDAQNASTQDRLVVASRAKLNTHFGMSEGQLRQIEKTRQIPTSIRFNSPIRGTVLSKEVQEGQYVDQGMVLYRLADLSKVWITLDVYEQNLRYAKLGQDVAITTDAYPGVEFHGRVTFIDAAMNAETRTIRVRTEFDNPESKLKPNMFVEARIVAPIKDALVVPTSAIIATGKRTVVWVEARENTFEPRNVVVGASTDRDTEILEGLHEGEIVAVSGGFLIDSESQLSQSSGADTTPQRTEHHHGSLSGDDVKAEPSRYLRSRKKSGGIENINILVHGSYNPDVIHATTGDVLRLHFYRDEDSECTSEVVFKEFNIRTFLPPRDTTLVEIIPTKAGTIDFECGMGMVKGKIIVED